MKLTVRSKVANGLVLCLLVPRVAVTASEMFNAQDENLNSFAADDGFVLSPEIRPMAMISLQADPGGDPTACIDPSGTGAVMIDAPAMLITAENVCDPSGGGTDPSGGLDPSGCGLFGKNDMFEVSIIDPPPGHSRTMKLEALALDPSGVPVPTDEVKIVPDTLVFNPDDICLVRQVWVIGQNDGIDDGDQPYEVNVLDENGRAIDTLDGVNLDNDNYSEVSIDVLGPSLLSLKEKGIFTVRVRNHSKSLLKGSELIIEPSLGLAITNYAASLASGGKIKTKVSNKSGNLAIKINKLGAGDLLLVSLDVFMFEGGPEDQKITARFVKRSGQLESDNDLGISTKLER